MNARHISQARDTAGVGGLFVGGASKRMGRAKGMLVGPDGRTLVERASAVLVAAGLEVVLVGRRGVYADLGMSVLDDAVEDAGPLGGLVSLLEHAGERRAVALACDMPFVTQEDVLTLLEATGPVAAPRRDGRWEPLCAMYAPSVLPVARRRLAEGRRSMQGLLEEVGAVEVAIDPDHVVDWDSPEDVNAR